MSRSVSPWGSPRKRSASPPCLLRRSKSFRGSWSPPATPGSPLLGYGTLDLDSDSGYVSPRHLSLHVLRAPTSLPHLIFELPEILDMIMSHLDAYSVEQAAASKSLLVSPTPTSSPVKEARRSTGPLFNCLQVNRTWFKIARHHLLQTLVLLNELQFALFAAASIPCAPRAVVVRRLFHTPQETVDRAFQHTLAARLTRLEFHLCVQATPPPHLLTGLLQTLVLPGGKTVDDACLETVAARCPRLAHLDVRACDRITDAGVAAIGTRCQQLEFLNIGRHRDGHKLTDASLVHVGRGGRLRTLGVAGCGITDRGLWRVIQHLGHAIERLSLNGCHGLSDRLVAHALRAGRLPRLVVLELRGCAVTDDRALVEFRRRQYLRGVRVVVGGDAGMEQRLRREEVKMDLEISRIIIEDLSVWVNQEEEEV